MPLRAPGWTLEEEEKLIAFVQPNHILYSGFKKTVQIVLNREQLWQEIAQTLNKPVEECRKRWRGLRDSYLRSKRLGGHHQSKTDIYKKLEFLGSIRTDSTEESLDLDNMDEQSTRDTVEKNEQVITDNHEYYEITLLDDDDNEQDERKPKVIKLVSKNNESRNQESSNHESRKNESKNHEAPKKILKRAGRKKTAPPMPTNLVPVKILPKPIFVNNTPRVLKYAEPLRTPEQRSQAIDKLIEKVLRENTNEIDVFFRSMAASVKKLQPNLIPKVKMEVCNVIAKYEMQSFGKQNME